MNMAAVMPESEEDEKSIADYVSVFKRRKKQMTWAAGSVLLISVLAALFWPPTYRSSATILIEEQEIPQELVRSTITGFAKQEIEVISQRVLTLNTIMDIVRKYQLWDDDEIQRMPRSEIMEKFRKKMRLDLVSAEVVDPRVARPMEATIAFTLSFDHSKPAVAQKVTNELVNLYMNENLKNRTEKSSATAEFLKNEAEQLSQHINDIESKIAVFKNDNEGALPELYQYNISSIDRVDVELRESKARLEELQKHKLELQSNMDQISPYGATELPNGERVLSDSDRLKALQSEYRQKSAVYNGEHPDVVRLQREIAALKEELGNHTGEGKGFADQLRAAQDKLSQLKQSYTADHPEVIKQRNVVEALLNQKNDTSEAITNADNPSYVMLDNQLKSTNAEIRSLTSRISDLTSKLNKLEGNVSKSPNVEKTYAGLMRDMQSTSNKYAEIKQKQMEAELAQNLESERKGERYELIQPPILPDEPVKPNRTAILFIGVVLAIASAAAAATVLELLDQAIKGPGELFELMGMVPLATIPYVTISEEENHISKSTKIAWMAAVAAVVLVLFLIHFFYKPLDVIWFVVLRKLGLGY